MPRKPDWSKHVPDPRLISYRGAVARLFRGDEEIGLALVRIEPHAQLLSGRLWWRRWAPSHDRPWVFTIVDGTFSDSVVDEDGIEDEVRDWEAGRFRYCGEVLLAQWVPAAEAAHLRRSQFGFEDDEF
jgi:hypothetical protein